MKGNIMTILNIAGYQFTALDDLATLKQNIYQKGSSLNLKGTVLLSHEGININLAGKPQNISDFINLMKQDQRFHALRFHETHSDIIPFKRLKIKIKNEIITFRQKEVSPLNGRAHTISPVLLKKWLDDNKEMTLLDTRNTYEIEYGSFDQAIHLSLNDFCELPTNIQHLEKQKPLVMFCTGGIRCEKAALYLTQQGFNEVYQLDGGILGYFEHIGRDHYQGHCFVFDDRNYI